MNDSDKQNEKTIDNKQAQVSKRRIKIKSEDDKETVEINDDGRNAEFNRRRAHKKWEKKWENWMSWKSSKRMIEQIMVV